MLNLTRLRLQNLHQIPARLWMPQIASAIAIIVGSFVLLGWYLDFTWLKNSISGSHDTMKANAALCFLLSGISLWLSALGQRKTEIIANRRRFLVQKVTYFLIAKICALAVLLISGLTIVEYLFGWNLGIDDLLFRNSVMELTTTSAVRMAYNAAVNFVLISISLYLLERKNSPRSAWCVQILALIAALISLQALVRYVYKVDIFSSVVLDPNKIALPSVLSFLILCLGILWTNPDQGLMRVVVSDTYGGLLARRLLLPAVGVPFFIGWLIVRGEEIGWYDPIFGISLFTIVLIVIFVLLIWQSAAVIDNLSVQRDHAQEALKLNEEKLSKLVDANIIGIVFSDIYGGIYQANDEFLGLIGYSREELVAGKVRWNELTPPDCLHLDDKGIAEAKLNGACVPYEKEFIHKSGHRVPALIGYIVLGENRDQAVGFILDLKERRQAEAKILQLNKDLQRRVVELQTLLDMIPIGIGIAEDAECQNIRINPSFAKILQVSPNTNASFTAPIEERPTTFKLCSKGRALSPEELPMQYAAANGVEVLDLEIDVVHQNGKIINLLEYVAPLFDEEGNTRGCIGAFLDITQRKQVEEVLRNQQKWLEDVLNLMPIPLLFIEPETARVIFANHSADELAGGSFPKGVSAQDYQTVYYYTDVSGNPIPPEQMPGVRVARGERLEGLEVEWHTCSGIHSILIFADTLPAMHGYPSTCVLAFQDITNLKKVEKALSLGYNRLQLLFDTANNLLSSQQPVALIDSVFRQLSVQMGLNVYFNYLVEDNSLVMRLASYRGISPEIASQIEFLKFGQSVTGTVAQQRCAMAVENVQQSNDPKTELIRSLGITAYYAYPLIAQGRLLGTLSFGSRTQSNFTENQKGMMQAVCDQIAIAMERASLITSLQQQTEQLSQANRMKDEFLAILSHELRSPLNAILGWAQLLRTRKFSQTHMDRGLETIERNARMQTQLIEDLLDISRMIRGQMRMNVHTCNLVTIIESAIDTVSLAAQAKNINLEFTLIPLQERESEDCKCTDTGCSKIGSNMNSQFLLSGDVERLQQIVWNLLSNAIKFTHQGGRVDVRLSSITANLVNVDGKTNQHLPTTSYAQIQITDTGIGITPEFLPYVFDRFRQADSSSTRSHGGLGLGLALVRHLVELHGGTVHADSPGEGQGATFTVNLPLLLSSKKVTIEPVNYNEVNLTSIKILDTFTSLLGIQVLVVDDEVDSRQFITTVLEQCQAVVQAVASVPEALQVISQCKPDVLVSDIGMPEEDGYSLIRKVRLLPPEEGGKIPAAALTAYARSEDRRRAIQEGYQLHLPKPIEPAELATVVASLVGRT